MNDNLNWTHAHSSYHVSTSSQAGKNICDEEQKGFISKRAECNEHDAVANPLINYHIQRRNPIYILSLDLKYAFGSVPHDFIRMNKKQLGILENVRNLVMGS